MASGLCNYEFYIPLRGIILEESRLSAAYGQLPGRRPLISRFAGVALPRAAESAANAKRM